jgi:hypothetical protein
MVSYVVNWYWGMSVVHIANRDRGPVGALVGIGDVLVGAEAVRVSGSRLFEPVWLLGLWVLLWAKRAVPFLISLKTMVMRRAKEHPSPPADLPTPALRLENRLMVKFPRFSRHRVHTSVHILLARVERSMSAAPHRLVARLEYIALRAVFFEGACVRGPCGHVRYMRNLVRGGQPMQRLLARCEILGAAGKVVG